MRTPLVLLLGSGLVCLLVACGNDNLRLEPDGAGGTTATQGTGGSDSATGELWLDDFEDGDAHGLIAGSTWSTYDDSGNGGASRITTPLGPEGLAPTGEGYESTLSMLVDFSFDKKDYIYEPFVGIGLTFQGYQDFDGYQAVAYTYRGYAHELRLETSSVTDYDFFAIQLPATSDWTSVEIWLDDLRQGGWGKAVDKTFSQVERVSFHMRGESATGTGRIEIDNLRMLETATVDDTPDLEILPLDPPDEVDLGDITIDDPFATYATAALDRGYNITNWLESGRFEDFGQYDEAFVQKLSAAGFESLRLPIDLDLYVEQADPLVVSDDLWTVLDSFDAWTKAEGMSLTVDYHQYDGNFDPSSTGHVALMADLWGAVAAHFAPAARADLFFELLNEPALSADAFEEPTQAEWSTIAESFIAAIRAEDSDRPIIFGDVDWYGIDELTNRQPFDDDYVVYAIHFYEPFVFTHQGAAWANLSAAHDLPYPYDPDRWSVYYRDLGFSETTNEAWQLGLLESYNRDATPEALYNRIGKAKAWAVEHQVALVCNEFGALDLTSQKADRIRYYTDLIEVFRRQEISWQIWFMVMDPVTGEVDPELAAALGLGN